MSQVTITLSDEDGQIACNAAFIGGFDPKSHAHQHAQILLGMMDDLCTKQTDSKLHQSPENADQVGA